MVWIWTFFGIFFVATLIIGGLEIIRDTRNPLSKFENGDKRFDRIPIEKTRKITL